MNNMSSGIGNSSSSNYTNNNNNKIKKENRGGSPAVGQHVHLSSTAKLPIETVKRLIVAIGKRPSLWMRNNLLKREEVNRLWAEVGEEVHLPVDICRVKWGHLRDNFRKVFIRNTYSGGTPTTWRFYNDMRFMEDTVAENIRKQNRSKSVNGSWLEPETQLFAANHFQHNRHSIGDFKNNFDFNYTLSDSNSQSMTDINMYPRKRMKHNEKTFDFADDDKFFPDNYTHDDLPHKQPSAMHHNNFQMQAIHAHGHGQAQELDDDDFDEDTVTDDNEEGVRIIKNEYPIEVFDDDDDDDEVENHMNRDMKPMLPLFPKISNMMEPGQSSDANNSSNSTHEEDSDRMFLLSLLPYLQSVDGGRKLRIRQRLQNVLIEELG